MSFSALGYSIINCESIDSYDELYFQVYNCIRTAAHDLLSVNINLLEHLHQTVPPTKINNLRVSAYNALNKGPVIDLIYSQIKSYINNLLGPDLAVQAKVNLSIVPPHDTGSTIPLHSDVNTGESTSQVVVWIPFTDCFDSNSLFIADLEGSLKLHESLPSLNRLDSPTIDQYADKLLKVRYLTVRRKQILVFSPILFHGSNTNKTDVTRVSLNVRFKNLHTEYEHTDCVGKSLGSFYKELATSELTKIVAQYKKPFFK